MKTTTFKLTSLFLSLVWSIVVCPQAHGQLLTSPSEEQETPAPVVEQQSPPQSDTKTKSSDDASSKDSDAKAKKAAKKKKQKEEKSDAVSTDDKAEDASGKKSDVKKADEGKSKKADKKKTEKSDDKTAEGKDADTKKTDKSAEKKADEAKPGDKDETPPAITGDGVKRAKSTVPLPTQLASFTCGAVLGYPVAFAKRTVHQTKAGNKDFIGESTNPVAVTLATIVSLPFGFVGGMFEGAQYSVYNSWMGSGQEPFGKESFSLSDD